MFINNEGQPDTNRSYRDLAIELRARAPAPVHRYPVHVPCAVCSAALPTSRHRADKKTVALRAVTKQ